MKKLFSIFVIAFVCILSMTSCHFVSPSAEEEAVLIDHPIFFGHGGVNAKPVETGLTWCWFSTASETFKIIPVRYDEAFDDIFSNDNTPLDFNSYITIQIEKGKTPILLQNYGVNWYTNNIQVKYRNYTREEVSKYNPFDLISNREVLNRIDSAVLAKMNIYIATLSKEKEFPIIIKNVITGAARPNKDQLEEMNKTAQYIQQKRSMEQKSIAEQARADAERKRALADKAYMSAMALSPDQFIQLKYIEMITNKPGANIDVMVGPATSMWNIRR